VAPLPSALPSRRRACRGCSGVWAFSYQVTRMRWHVDKESTKPDETPKKTDLDRAGAQLGVMVVAGQPASGHWWDAPYRKSVVPPAWSPVGFLDCIKSVEVPALGGELVPCTDARREDGLVRNYSFVAVAIRSFDAAGNRTDLPASVRDLVCCEAVGGRVPGSLMVSRRGQCFVVFLLARPIARKEQPEGKAATSGVFYLASKGAEWLVDQSLKGLQIARARPAAIQTGCVGANSKSPERSSASRVRNAIRMIDGIAVQAILSDSRGIPLDGDILPSKQAQRAEYLTLAEKLWHPEELASYAPAVQTRERDAVWDFVQAVKDESRRRKARDRLLSAYGELVNNGVFKVDDDWPAFIESSIERFGRFATEWSDSNEQLVGAGLPPLGAEAGSSSSAVLSCDSIWDPASTFVHELRSRLLVGDWYVALKDGGVPHGVGASPGMLGWARRENDQHHGGTPWMASGLSIGWIDIARRELLLDVEAVTHDFASRGPSRCARLCMKPAQLARILLAAGLLAPTANLTSRRRVLGESHKVLRMRLDAVPFDPVRISRNLKV